MLDPTDSEILECLTRSGYLLESRLVSRLNENGFFVDPNQMIVDPNTGKSRELDIVTEYYDRDAPRRPRCCVKAIFVIEAINNPYPVVLLTERPSSPNSGFEDYTRCWVTGPQAVTSAIVELELDELKLPSNRPLYAQYCGISKKKANGDLMASHLDDLYSSLTKAVRYSADNLNSHEIRQGNDEDEYWRVFFWQPVLALSGRLLVTKLGPDQQPILEETDAALLEFNYHDDDYQRSMVVQVVTEDALIATLKQTVAVDSTIEQKLHERRQAEDT